MFYRSALIGKYFATQFTTQVYINCAFRYERVEDIHVEAKLIHFIRRSVRYVSTMKCK